MLHLIAEPFEDTQPPAAYAEAVSRLASVRHALRLVGPFGAGPEGELDADIDAQWNLAGPARRHCFDRSTQRTVAATAAGLEALLGERQAGREPHQAASDTLVTQIRRELEEIAGIILR
jgi:hypothetical protein